MPMRLTFDRRFQTELRSVLATLQCLSDYAAEKGDSPSAAILGNAAGLLELSLVSNAKALVRPPVPTRKHLRFPTSSARSNGEAEGDIVEASHASLTTMLPGGGSFLRAR